MLCKHRHIFGEERKGFHSYRLFDIAIGDFIGTVIIAVIISYYTKYNFLITLVTLLLLGIIAHRLFCVNTKINMMIFGKV